jgi:hypothetical protein
VQVAQRARAEERRIERERQAEENRHRILALSNFTFQVEGKSQSELFDVANRYVTEVVGIHPQSAIQTSNQSTGELVGVLFSVAGDGIVYLYNSTFSIRVNEGEVSVSKSSPTRRHIGFASPTAKEAVWLGYWTALNASQEAQRLAARLTRTSVDTETRTQARERWERENAWTSTNPGPVEQVDIGRDAALQQAWADFAQGLSNSL